DDPDILMNYLISMEKYRVAGRILVKTLQRQAGDIPLAAFILTAAASAVILYAVFRGTLGLWKKGETHVGIF
ncbi:MAG TPA: hypothetical protein VLA34_11720, partial [Candidatus Krumholzibacterium sp.]|nr:hypothetical protein [Candidatus Krumholzibacterium sp.]